MEGLATRSSSELLLSAYAIDLKLSYGKLLGMSGPEKVQFDVLEATLVSHSPPKLIQVAAAEVK